MREAFGNHLVDVILSYISLSEFLISEHKARQILRKNLYIRILAQSAFANIMS